MGYFVTYPSVQGYVSNFLYMGGVVYVDTHNLKKKTSDCYCVSFSFGVVWLLPVVYYWWCSGGSVVVQYSWWCEVVV